VEVEVGSSVDMVIPILAPGFILFLVYSGDWPILLVSISFPEPSPTEASSNFGWKTSFAAQMGYLFVTSVTCNVWSQPETHRKQSQHRAVLPQQQGAVTWMVYSRRRFVD